MEEVGVGPELVDCFSETLCFVRVEHAAGGRVVAPAEAGVDFCPAVGDFGVLSHFLDEGDGEGWQVSRSQDAVESNSAAEFSG